jgi:uncharacterized protein YdhG (YjbR/CyaY superfamily)
MKAGPKKFETVDEYLSVFPKNVKSILEQLRKTIQQAAPQAEELISYNMPAFRVHGMLVYYAAYKEHIGFYPGAGAIINGVFKNELAGYETSKGTIRFPIEKALPLGLIRNIVKYRVKQNLEKEKAKEKKKNKV